jgi:hypothetical protein
LKLTVLNVKQYFAVTMGLKNVTITTLPLAFADAATDTAFASPSVRIAATTRKLSHKNDE